MSPGGFPTPPRTGASVMFTWDAVVPRNGWLAVRGVWRIAAQRGWLAGIQCRGYNHGVASREQMDNLSIHAAAAGVCRVGHPTGAPAHRSQDPKSGV